MQRFAKNFLQVFESKTRPLTRIYIAKFHVILLFFISILYERLNFEGYGNWNTCTMTKTQRGVCLFGCVLLDLIIFKLKLIIIFCVL
ncbi:hypothetical protein Hanom_Chr10g00894821 [Helianthus anomalus]